jgi:catechol 2,3-dioxygenase-like lactoylglutathione lyase family enzyme
MTAIGRISSVALACPDPAALADFYARITGWKVVFAEPDWCSIAASDDSWHLSFQRVPDHQPPVWPHGNPAMQCHLHIKVADLDTAEQQMLMQGASAFPDQPSRDNFRVMADPAGHILCLVPERS